MKLKHYLSLYLLAIILMVACTKKEALLEPTKEPEDVYGDFTLPQGNHAFDTEILDFFKKYNTLILYKFEEQDIFWNVTQYIEKAKYDSINNYTTKGFFYTPADEAYIPALLNLLKTQFFKYFTDDFLVRNLPKKIFLLDQYAEIKAGTGKPEDLIVKKIPVTAGFDFIAAAGANSAIANMTSADIKLFRSTMANFFLQRLTTTGAIQRTSKFSDLTNYSLTMPTWEATYGNGIIDWNRRAPNTDWDAYLEMILTKPYETLIAPGGFLHPSIDNKGVIRKKYNVMIAYFMETYNIDLLALAND